jgi:mRNA interferase RelE/StbE
MNSKKWTVKWDQSTVKDLKLLSKEARKRIFDYMDKKINQQTDPQLFGSSLIGNKGGLWRYRVGDYRIICQVIDFELIVLVVAVGHRKEVYK